MNLYHNYYHGMTSTTFTLPHCWALLKDDPKWNRYWESVCHMGNRGNKDEPPVPDVGGGSHDKGAPISPSFGKKNLKQEQILQPLPVYYRNMVPK